MLQKAIIMLALFAAACSASKVPALHLSNSQDCNADCSSEHTQVTCAFDTHEKYYRVFLNQCSMTSFAKCYDKELVETPLKYCIKQDNSARRDFIEDESCPIFCPEYYRPVCGASKLRDYVYRTFNNGCFLDMLNCRGADHDDGYVEVPLSFCQNHLMKNIFKNQMFVSNTYDYHDGF